MYSELETVQPQESIVSENKDTPVMFASDAAAEIRDMLLKPGTPVVCPKCGEDLNVSGPVSAGKTVGPVYHVVCKPCRRHAAIRDIPAKE